MNPFKTKPKSNLSSRLKENKPQIKSKKRAIGVALSKMAKQQQEE